MAQIIQLAGAEWYVQNFQTFHVQSVLDSLGKKWPEVLAAAQHVLLHRGIAHVTLQPEASVHAVRWIPRITDAGAAINGNSAVKQEDAK